MSKWSQYAQKAGPKSRGTGGGGGLFLRLKDGDSVKYVVPPTATPHQRYQRWTGSEYEQADGPGEGVKAQILVPVMVVPDNEIKILGLSPTAFVTFCDRMADPDIGGNEQVYRMKRTGADLDTVYDVQRLDRATPDQIAMAARHAIPDLSQWGDPIPGVDEPAKKATASKPQPAQTQPDSDVPF